MVECHPKSVLADPNSCLENFAISKSEEEISTMKNVPYRQPVGGLLYVMVISRSDIAYSVGQVA